MGKRKVGRPRMDPRRVLERKVIFRLYPDDERRLDALARAWDTTRTEVLRRLIRRESEKQDAKSK